MSSFDFDFFFCLNSIKCCFYLSVFLFQSFVDKRRTLVDVISKLLLLIKDHSNYLSFKLLISRLQKFLDVVSDYCGCDCHQPTCCTTETLRFARCPSSEHNQTSESCAGWRQRKYWWDQSVFCWWFCRHDGGILDGRLLTVMYNTR